MKRAFLALALCLPLAACGTTGQYVKGQINVAHLDANGKLYFTQLTPGGNRGPEVVQSISTYNPIGGGLW